MSSSKQTTAKNHAEHSNTRMTRDEQDVTKIVEYVAESNNPFDVDTVPDELVNITRGDQIEVFKILNGYENIDSNIFFEIKESKITRGHNYTLVKKQSRLDVRKYSFSQRTINVWNTLSTDCVHASSVNMFKNKIDKYLAKAGYT